LPSNNPDGYRSGLSADVTPLEAVGLDAPFRQRDFVLG
jgi:hypothetical protein